MTVYADFSQVDKLAVDLAASGAKVAGASKTIVSTTAREVHARAVADAPVLTGELKGSIYIHDDTIGSDVKQGFYQEFGTTRHGPQPWLFTNAEDGGDRIALELDAVAGSIL